MEIVKVSPGVIAFVRPDEGANTGLIRTLDGAVMVDTTSSPTDMQRLLDAMRVSASEARLVVNTHYHSDHTWGNQLFDCPILAHRLCRERMEARLTEEWTPEAIEQYITEVQDTEPDWAQGAREKWANLRITLPSEVFDDRREAEIGGVTLEVIRFGGHTPDSAVVWLPEAKALFAGDLIFEGRYPYVLDADVPALVSVLKRLPDFGAETIVPGHGVLCGDTEIANLVHYLETTWTLTADHVARGHTADEAVADPSYPRYAEDPDERFHEENIRFMYDQLTEE